MAPFFVIHVDKRASSDIHAAIRTFSIKSGDILLAPTVRCYWELFGIVRATLNCITEAVRSGRPFHYAMLLSGQDYPLKPVRDIHRFLESHRGLEFIEAFPLNQPNRWTLQGGVYQAMSRVRYFTFSFRSRTVHIKFPRRFYGGWQPYGPMAARSGGASPGNACSTSTNTSGKNPSFLRYFRSVFIPDETMFQSLVANSPFAKSIYANDLRYTDWRNPNPHYPRTLEGSDLDRLKASPCLIGRKFDTVQSADLLDLLDRDDGPDTPAH
jgi:Core-2/I-Branching enzyme